MDHTQDIPSLDQYPGYFPPAKSPFWTRSKVGIVAAIAGLVVGIGAAGAGEAAEPAPSAAGPAAEAAPVSDTQDEAVVQEEAAVQDELADLERRLDEAQDDATARLHDVRSQMRDARAKAVAQIRRTAAATQRRAVSAAVAQARTQAQAAQAQAVAAAAAQAAPQAAPSPQPVASTDPRFSYCYEANDAGYGNYVQGRDPEYYWYDDNDNDGVVCET